MLLARADGALSLSKWTGASLFFMFLCLVFMQCARRLNVRAAIIGHTLFFSLWVASIGPGLWCLARLASHDATPSTSVFLVSFGLIQAFLIAHTVETSRRTLRRLRPRTGC